MVRRDTHHAPVQYKDQVRSVVGPASNDVEAKLYSSNDNSVLAHSAVLPFPEEVQGVAQFSSPERSEEPSALTVPSGVYTYSNGTPMVVAELIGDDDLVVVDADAAAERYDSNASSARVMCGKRSIRKTSLYLLICGVLLALLTIALLGVLLLDPKSLSSSARRPLVVEDQLLEPPTTAPSSSPSAAPSRNQIRVVLLREFIHHSSFSGKNISYPGNSTAEEKALTWMVEDDPLGLTESDYRRILQRYALATIFFQSNAMHRDVYKRWLDVSSECDWNAVTCAVDTMDPDFLIVTSLRLRFNYSSIPSDIGLLTGLERLELQGGHAVGTLPSILARLTQLKELCVNGNLLEGSLGPLANLTGLEKLDLGRNRFTGTVPTGLFTLPNLRQLHLNDNRLSGLVLNAARYETVSALAHVDLSNNVFNQIIPSELSQLTSLTTLNATNGNLKGTIPSEMALLSRLTDLKLSRNKLAGAIWDELSLLSELRILQISQNNLSGPFPEWINELSQLEELKTSFNRLTGTLPRLFPSSLRVFSIDENDIAGPLPDGSQNLTDLVSFTVSGNPLTGSIPSELSAWTSLQTFRIGGTSINGTIPSSIGPGWALLNVFDAKATLLEGPLPASIGSWSAMSQFGVDQCMGLTGTLPWSIANWTDAISVTLTYTNLTGSMPLCSFPDGVPGGVNVISADCDMIDCPCCTHCKSNADPPKTIQDLKDSLNRTNRTLSL